MFTNATGKDYSVGPATEQQPFAAGTRPLKRLKIGGMPAGWLGADRRTRSNGS